VAREKENPQLEKENPQFMVVGRVGGTVLSSKQVKKLFSLSISKTSVSAMWLVVRDCL
jgi:hypothetical protein